MNATTDINAAARRVAEAAVKAERFDRDAKAAHSDSGVGVLVHAERAEWELSRATEAYERAKKAGQQ